MHVLTLGAHLTLSCRYRILVFACLTALLCLAAGLLGSYLLYGGSAFAPLSLALSDEDGSVESGMLLDYLEGLDDYQDVIRFSVREPGRAARMVESGEADAAVVIPPGFMAGVMDGGNLPFKVILSASYPLRSELVRIFADSYAHMLKTGQMGVYAALDAASRTGGDEWMKMYQASNLRFLSAILSRRDSLDRREVSVTGAVSPALHYAAAAFVFLMLLGSSLFLDVWAGAACRPVLLRLRALGAHPAVTGLSFCLSASIPFAAVCLLLAATASAACAALKISIPVSAGLACCLLLITLCAGAFLFAASRLLGAGPAGAAGVFLLSLLGLFLSGGVVPSAYLSPALQGLAKCTPHYWLSALLARCLSGQADAADFLPAAACACLLAGLGVLDSVRGGRVGKLP